MEPRPSGSRFAAALNENSRRLAAWAAIFAVGTLIAGIYGMNFSLLPATGSHSASGSRSR